MKTFYRAYLRANTGMLIGGVKYHESIQFATKLEADMWLLTILESNERAGRSVGDRGVKEIKVKRRA